MREELSNLSQLNAAMFRQIFSGDQIGEEIFAARQDKTDPAADGCSTSSRWDLRIEGDFHLVKQVHDSLYIIVGDATGHHAYAGGLKLFVAAALQNIFRQFSARKRAPSPSTVLRKLNDFFLKVGKEALIEDPERPLRDGTCAIVLRVATTTKEVTYGGAGLPVIAVGPKRTAEYGKFRNSKVIAFPRTLASTDSFEPQAGRIEVREARYLVVVTDGFVALKREANNPGSPPEAESFGWDRILATLNDAVDGLRQGPSAPPPAAQIANALVAAARAFRKGCTVSEGSDDDRLVVVADLQAIWRRDPAQVITEKFSAQPPPATRR